MLHELAASPYIVPLIHAFRHDEKCALVLPYFKSDLQQYVRTRTLGPAACRALTKQLVMAGAHLGNHNVMHGQLKLENVLVVQLDCKAVLDVVGNRLLSWKPLLLQLSGVSAATSFELSGVSGLEAARKDSRRILVRRRSEGKSGIMANTVHRAHF